MIVNKIMYVKYSIRNKLIWLFTIIVLFISISLTYISTQNQTKSLWEEKDKQANIILTSLARSIRSKLIQVYSENYSTVSRLKRDQDYLRFYKSQEIDHFLFEDFDLLREQADLVYAFYLGKGGYVLSHTNPSFPLYTKYPFKEDIVSYTNLYKKQNLEKADIIKVKTTTNKTLPSTDKNKNEKYIDSELFHYTHILSFQSEPNLKNAIGELHIGISLNSINQEIFKASIALQIVAFFATIFAIIISIIFATFLTRPIKHMIHSLQRLTKGDFSATVKVSSKDEVGIMANNLNAMLIALRTLVSPEVAQVVLSGDNLSNIHNKIYVTAIFCDVRSFTSLSERLSPVVLLRILNNYLTFVSSAVIKYGGVVDKFIGDEVFATFGAPFKHPCQELCATATILEIQKELDLYNQSVDLPIKIGIGVNSGQVVSGTIGSQANKLDYTCIGDNINLASRLQGSNKVYKTVNNISEFTYEKIADYFYCREIDLIIVKGKDKPIKVYEVLGIKPLGQQKIDEYLEQTTSLLKAG